MIKSKKIRESARGEDCTLRLGNCSSNETVVLCHVGRRRGMGIKCSDNMAVYGCHNCHSEIDSKPKSYYAEDLMRALEETQEKLIDKGLLVFK